MSSDSLRILLLALHLPSRSPSPHPQETLKKVRSLQGPLHRQKLAVKTYHSSWKIQVNVFQIKSSVNQRKKRYNFPLVNATCTRYLKQLVQVKRTLPQGPNLTVSACCLHVWKREWDRYCNGYRTISSPHQFMNIWMESGCDLRVFSQLLLFIFLQYPSHLASIHHTYYSSHIFLGTVARKFNMIYLSTSRNSLLSHYSPND